MTRPTQCFQRAHWLSAGLLLLVVGCDDKSSETTDDAEHGDHGHDGGDEHAHGEASNSDSKSGSSEGKAGASARADSSKSAEPKAGAGGKASSKPASGTGGKSASTDKPDAGEEEAAAGGGGKSAGKAGAGGEAEPDAPADAGTGGVAGGAEGGSGGSKAAANSGETMNMDMDVTIRFKAKLGDQAFACGSTYEMQGAAATTVTPQDLRLFIQDLALIKADGSRVPIKNATRAPWQSETVALLDFEDATGNCAGTTETNDEITGTIPAGTYTGLSFANGVPEALNHADATKQADPLKSSASLSWSWLGGFRFAKVELVKTDTQNFGEGVFHPGSQACTGNPAAGEVSCSKPNRNQIVIEAFDPDNDSVVIDLAALFAKTDLSMDSACHSGATAVCESLFDAWGINLADGKPKQGQTVFKKE